MRLSQLWFPRTCARGRSCRKTRQLNTTIPPRLEVLEDRALLSIVWANRGVLDFFDDVFGGSANFARSVVDSAFNAWNQVVRTPSAIPVTVSMNPLPGDRSRGASTFTWHDLFTDMPSWAVMQIGRGSNGQGGSWYLDPFLFSSEFQGEPGNAFAGYAQAGSRAAGKDDLLEVVTHELGHALGLDGHRVNRMSTDTGVVDQTSVPGNPSDTRRGHYYAFVGPTGFGTLLTSFNSLPGGGGEDTQGGEHSAAAGDPRYPISFRGRLFYGADDLMNPYYGVSQRRLISRNDAFVLRDAYGYAVNDPATALGTFYASLDQTGQLTVRGVQNRSSSDVITLDVSGGNVTVSLRFGNPVPGTADTGTYDASFSVSRVGSIRVETGGTPSVVNLYRTPSGVPININGNGPLTVNVGTAGTTQGVLGPVYVTDSVAGAAAIYIDDRADTGRRDISHMSYTPPGETEFGQISGLTLRSIGYRYASVNRVDVHTGTGATSTYVDATGSPINFISHSTNNSVSIGRGGEVRNIRGTVNVINWVGTTRLTIDDSADTISRSVTMSGGQLSGLAPADILYSSLASLTVGGGGAGNTFTVSQTISSGSTALYTGTGSDSVFVQRTTGALTIEGQDGSDNVTVGNARSLQEVRGMLTVNNRVGYTTLTLDDSADPSSRNATLTSADISGLAPARIYFQPLSLRSLTIAGGSGGNTFTVTSTPVSDFPATTTLNSGTGSDRVDVRGTFGPLTIDGQTGLNTVNVGNTVNGLQDIRGAVTVRSSGGSDSLAVDDLSDTVAHTVTLDTFTTDGSPYGRITGLAPTPIEYKFNDTRRLDINTSSGGGTVIVLSTGPLALGTSLLGFGPTAVNVGNPANGVQDILGTLHVRNPSNFATLNVDDSADTTSRGMRMDVSGLTGTITGLTPGSAVIDWRINDVSAVTVTGGSSGSAGGPGNTFTITNTSSSTFLPTVPTTLNTGTANNTVNVQGTALGGPLTINMGNSDVVNVTNSLNTLAGINSVSVNDPTGTGAVNVDDSLFGGNSTYTITGTTLRGVVWPNFLLTVSNPGLGYNVATLNLNTGNGNNVFNIEGTSATTTVTAGNGVNTVNISPAAQDLNTIAGSLTVNLGTFTNNQITMYDVNNPSNPSNYTISDTSASVDTLPGFVFNYNFRALTAPTGIVDVEDSTPGSALVDNTVNITCWFNGGPCTPSGGFGWRGEEAFLPNPAIDHGLLQMLFQKMRKWEATLMTAAQDSDDMASDLLALLAKETRFRGTLPDQDAVRSPDWELMLEEPSAL